MTHYLLSVYQPDGPIPAPDRMQKIMEDVEALNQEIRAAGAWVFAGGLQPPDTARVLRGADAEVLSTDGPYTEGKEHLGGFTHRRRARSRRRAWLGRQAHPGDRPADRGPPVRPARLSIRYSATPRPWPGHN